MVYFKKITYKGMLIIKKIKIIKIIPESLRVNVYTQRPYRVIGLIGADIEYHYGVERVTLAFYRSSGTNSGKIKGLWYPIVGIKTTDGDFNEFTDYLNLVLRNSTHMGSANAGWLAKSLFFADQNPNNQMQRGFSNGRHHKALRYVGNTLQGLYDSGQYRVMDKLNSDTMNRILMAEKIYPNNQHTQRENYERFMEEIYIEDILKRADVPKKKAVQTENQTAGT